MVITDVGFAYIPGILPSIGNQSKFLAPEINHGEVLEDGEMPPNNGKIAGENPGMADIWSLGMIAMYLALGSTDHDPEVLVDLQLEKELIDFI